MQEVNLTSQPMNSKLNKSWTKFGTRKQHHRANLREWLNRGRDKSDEALESALMTVNW